MDGAEWLQGFVNYHRVDAVRILDFPHAAEYVSAFGQAVSQAGGKVTTDWLDEQLHRLKHEGPQALLADLRALQAKHPEVELLREHLTYLSRTRGAHAVSNVSSRWVADWLWHRGECEQGSGRNAFKRSRHALEAGERQRHAGIAQCDVQ